MSRTRRPTLPTSTSPKARSADPVTAYAHHVVAGKIIAGPLVRAASARHLRDLEEARERELFWDKAAARRAIQFFADILCLAEGEHAGQSFVLQPWQQFIVGSLFGWRGADGYRRFRTAYIEVGKGNGKSPMAAGIGSPTVGSTWSPQTGPSTEPSRPRGTSVDVGNLSDGG